MASEPFLGTIFLFAPTFAPRGYKVCDGSLLPISQFTALFSLLGTTYGGDGRTTFALPDLRSRVPIGASLGSGPAGLTPVIQGAIQGTENISQVPAHTHGLVAATTVGDTATPSGNLLATTGDGQGGSLPGFALASNAPPTAALNGVSISSSGGGPVDVRNPALGLLYIIAIEGIFPSRN